MALTDINWRPIYTRCMKNVMLLDSDAIHVNKYYMPHIPIKKKLNPLALGGYNYYGKCLDSEAHVPQ